MTRFESGRGTSFQLVQSRKQDACATGMTAAERLSDGSVAI
jgi:hypothetical protein